MAQLPGIVEKIIRAICPDHLIDEIEGDLIELYRHDLKSMGRSKARLRLFLTSLRFFRPGILLRNRFTNPLLPMYMFTNYSKIAVRVMARSKTFSAINISGLSMGITAALLLFLWIQHELSFEQFHADKERLYVAWNRASENGQINCWRTTPRVLAPTLQKEFAGIDQSVSYAQWGGTQRFKVGDKKILKTSGVYTDPAFLNILSFPLLKGNPTTALASPESLVLTEDFASELFGDEDALGQAVTISEGEYTFEFTVTGILKNLPTNTEFDFDYIIPFSFLEKASGVDNFWGNNSVTTLVKIKEGTDEAFINEQIRDVEKKHFKDGQHIEIFLNPLVKERLYSRFENGVPAGGKIDEVIVVAILAVCLVLIGCINFINLSTARAQKRAKEISVRKVTGALKRSLVMQFVIESTIMCFLASIISLGAAYMLLPWFNLVMHEQLSFSLLSFSFWLYFAMAVFVVGLLAGGYPAIYLSSMPSIRVMKFSVAGQTGRVMRNGLVVVQFGFAILLIVGSIVIYKQSRFLRNMDAGYDQKRLVYLPLSADLVKNFESFKNELLSEGIASSVSRTSTPFTEQWSGTSGMSWPGKNPEERTNVERIIVDGHITRTSFFTLLAGRDLDLDRYPSDSTAVLINESALRLMNMRNPIGEIINDNGRDWKIVGVVKDFVFVSPFMQKAPVVLFGCHRHQSLSFVYIRLDDQQPFTEVNAALMRLHEKYNPDYPFALHFADLEYQRKFEVLSSMQAVTGAATVTAIFIACIGLLGLAIYMIEVRRKEVGIRKVLGGSVFSIAKLLSVSSIKPILISIVLFAPMSWYVLTLWLELFPYRTTLDLWIFLVATSLILFIAVFTVATQTVRVAYKNPVDSLASE